MKGVGRNAVSAVLQIVVSSLIMFFLYRSILQELGVEMLGVWSITLATVSASRIGEFGLSASVTRFVARHSALGVLEKCSVIVQTAFLSIVLLFIILFPAVFFLLHAVFSRVFDISVLPQALELLPYAMCSLALSIGAGVFQSGLDGMQRYDIRALVVIGGQIVYFFAATWLIPEHGLMGLAYAQVLQGMLLILTSWFALKIILPCLPVLPRKWRFGAFREMLPFGAQYQIGSIAMMLFDPVTKLLLGVHGGLSSAGYYDMASQYVGRARALAVSANQVLIPVVAEINEKEPARVRGLYLQNLRITFFAVIPVFGLVSGWAAVLSEFLIGKYEPIFVNYTLVLSAAWCINTLCVPAFFFNQGRGKLSWNTWGYTLIGTTNVCLGYLLGMSFGEYGVLFASAVALSIGAGLIVIGFHRNFSLTLRSIFPQESFGICIAAILVPIFSYSIYHIFLEHSFFLRALACLFMPPLLMAPMLWMHPLRVNIYNRIYLKL